MNIFIMLSSPIFMVSSSQQQKDSQCLGPEVHGTPLCLIDSIIFSITFSYATINLCFVLNLN